jgi:putative PIN family toxin of toxin-antitoxin system
MKLVLDTDVIVAAMRSPEGGSAELLRRIDDGKALMVLSVALALEYEAKCTLAEHRIAAGFSVFQTEVFLNGLIALAEPARSHFRWRPQLRDPGDELVLEAAVNGQASMIVTFNVRDYPDIKRSFGIEIVRPGEALGRVK